MPGAGSGRSVEVRIVPACAANRVAVEAAAQEKVCRLAPERQVPGEVVTEAPADEVPGLPPPVVLAGFRSEEHTSELQSLMRISYAVFCLKKKKQTVRKTILRYIKNK